MNNRIVKINPAHQYKTTDHEDALATIAERYGCDVFWVYNKYEQLAHIRNINVNHQTFNNGRATILDSYRTNAGGHIRDFQLLTSIAVFNHTYSLEGQLNTPQYTLIGDNTMLNKFQHIQAISCKLLEESLKKVLANADQTYLLMSKLSIVNSQNDLETLIQSDK